MMFITLEGGDGAGKTTLLRGLSQYLNTRNIKHVTTREPGGTFVADQIRNLILDIPVNPVSETYLFAAARADHCHNVVIPQLLKGTTVLCDRFSGSTYVYQHCEKGVPLQYIESLYDSISEMFKAAGLSAFPAVTQLELVLDVNLETATRRLKGRTNLNVFDTLDPEIFSMRRQGYLAYAKLMPTAVVIDASGTEAEILDLAIRALEKVIAERGDGDE